MREKLTFIQTLALDAGDIMLQHWKRKIATFQKADLTIVTEVDLKISSMVVSRVREQWPGYGLLTEETCQAFGGESQGFIVDELDGTHAYANRRPGFTFQAAYYDSDNHAQIGVIYDPLRRLMLYAVRGEGVFLETDGHRSRLTPCFHAQWEKLRFANHRQFSSDTYRKLYARLGLSSEQIVSTGSIGSKVIDFVLGRVDALVSLNRHVGAWDWAPGKVILEELGFVVSHLGGEELQIEVPHPATPFGYLVCPRQHEQRLRSELRWITDRLAPQTRPATEFVLSA